MSIISDTINGTSTYSQSALTAAIEKKVQQKNINLATELFKQSVNLKEAIVSVLSNTGIAGFKFHVPESEQLRLQSDITDHYTDANTVIQDHIARKPIRITLNGLHGEYFYSVNQIEDTLAKIVPTLKLVEQFLPKLRPETIRLKTIKENYNNKIQAISKLKSKDKLPVTFNYRFEAGWNSLNGVDLFKLFQDIYTLKSAQTRAYLYFEALWKANQTFTVETSVKRFDNMVIEDLQPKRDNNADIMDFTIVFKQMGFAQSVYESLNNAAGRTRDQLIKTVKKGVDKGQYVDIFDPQFNQPKQRGILDV